MLQIYEQLKQSDKKRFIYLEMEYDPVLNWNFQN